VCFLLFLSTYPEHDVLLWRIKSGLFEGFFSSSPPSFPSLFHAADAVSFGVMEGEQLTGAFVSLFFLFKGVIK